MIIIIHLVRVILNDGETIDMVIIEIMTIITIMMMMITGWPGRVILVKLVGNLAKMQGGSTKRHQLLAIAIITIIIALFIILGADDNDYELQWW